MGIPVKVGIDGGGTLIKIAYSVGEDLAFAKFPSSRLTEAAAWVRGRFPGARLCLTGGKSAMLQQALAVPVERTMVEFDATSIGVKHLLERVGRVPESFILANAGTGTSIHYIHPEGHSRIGGTGVGGGTLLGLSYLLTGVSDYEEILTLAGSGNRDRVDLKVRHIYEGSEPPIPGDLTASNFGHVIGNGEDRTPSDILASVLGLVGETVTTASVLAAGQVGVTDIVYIGSSFIGNELLKEIVISYTLLRGAEPLVLEQGEYSGAIGALLSLT